MVQNWVDSFPPRSPLLLKGYFQVFNSGAAIPAPQPKTARKREWSKIDTRGKGKRDTEAVALPRLEDEEEVDGEGFWMASDGVEDDARRVRRFLKGGDGG